MKRHHNYSITVKDRVTGEYFVAYTAEDLDEADGYRAFCEAEMPGARVRIERIEWMEDDR